MKKLQNLFQQHFNCAASIIVQSPGRINLIGEHTDYNDGFVLPAAINKAIYVAISKRADSEIHLFSMAYSELYVTTIDNIQPQKNWVTYILGVVHQLQQKGFVLTGFNLLLDGDVPVGAGLSSSAAVECATAFALNEIFDLNISKINLVKLAQKAEHSFAGVQCGIMDQFASMFGKKNHAIQLDCRTLAFQYFPLQLQGIKIILLDTQVKHSLAATAYNKRREECEEGVAYIQKKYPTVKKLRDANIIMLNDCINANTIIYKRCKYVIEENERVQLACGDLAANDISSFGKKMFATHNGLSELYKVSCKELDFLVYAAKQYDGVLGARMMGGGFGGCTINLVKEEIAASFIKNIFNDYYSAMQKELKGYDVTLENGTSLL
jgi:galactokinase